MQRLLTFPSPRILRDLTLVAAFFTVFLFAVLQFLNAQMQPIGIVTYEFAFTPARARMMFDTWGEAGRAVAWQSLVIDFRFMPAYAVTFAGLVLMAARSASGELQSTGLDVFFLPFVAAVFDALENVMLMVALRSLQNPPAWALLVAGCAAGLKFSLLLISLGYIAWVAVARWRGRNSKSQIPNSSPEGGDTAVNAEGDGESPHDEHSRS